MSSCSHTARLASAKSNTQSAVGPQNTTGLLLVRVLGEGMEGAWGWPLKGELSARDTHADG